MKIKNLIKGSKILTQERFPDDITIADVFDNEELVNNYEIKIYDTPINEEEHRHYRIGYYVCRIYNKNNPSENQEFIISLVNRLYSEEMYIEDCYHKPVFYEFEKEEKICYNYTIKNPVNQ